MAFVLPPQNYITGPGDLDAILKDLSPTPELMEREPADLDEQEQYKRDLVACIRRCWDHESSANFDRWDKIGKAWELVNNNYSFPGDPDLSDMRTPETLMMVKQIAGVLFSMFELSSTDWWEPRTKVVSKQAYVNLVKDLVNDHLDNPRCNWWNTVEEGLDSLIITGHVTTMVAIKYGDTLQLGQGGPKDEEVDEAELSNTLFGLFQDAPEGSDKPFIPNNKLPLLHFRNLPTECVNKDTSSECMYHVWSMDLPVGLVFLNAEKMGWDKQALLRSKDKGYLANTSADSFVTSARIDRPRALDKSTNKLMRLTFHEGTLVDLDTGALLYEKKYTVMANECEIVYGPSDIPWWDNEPTLVDAPFLPLAHETYGRGLISENTDTLLMSANMLNQMLDYLNEALSGAYEYDQDRMRNEGQRTDLKIYPRQCIPVESGEGNAPPVVRRIPMGEVANSAWQVAQALDQRKVSVMASTNIGGSPRPRGRMTTMERKESQTTGDSLWRQVFRSIQNRWLAPMLRLSFLRLLQSYPQPLWKSYVMGKLEQLLMNDKSLNEAGKAKWTEAYTKAANWSKEQRYKELGSTFTFVVKVFSSPIERQSQVEKGAFLIRNLAAVPGLIQSVVNMREWVREMVVALGYDPEKILNKVDLNPPSAEVSNQVNPFEDDDDDVPNVAGGLGSLPSPGISGGVMPGGPISDTPQAPGPPPM